MQDGFARHYPSLDIQILGVNEDGHQSQNTLMVAQGDLPWLQDLDTDGDGQSDVWNGLWPSEYRDIQVVDRDGDLIDVYNVTTQDLNFAENFNTLRDIFVNAAATPQESPWQSPIEPLDANANGLVSPIDALVIINALNDGMAGTLEGAPAEGENFLDVTGEGALSPLDPLRIINHLNSLPSTAATVAVVDDAPRTATDFVFASYDSGADDDDDE